MTPNDLSPRTFRTILGRFWGTTKKFPCWQGKLRNILAALPGIAEPRPQCGRGRRAPAALRGGARERGDRDRDRR